MKLETRNSKLRRTRRRSRQSGYVLLVIMLMMVIMMIAAVAIAPAIATQIRRDREEEMMHRGTQYARAIKRFYRKTGRYPARLEELENTNQVRFLRKRYKDPIANSDQWRIIHLGEARIIPKTFTIADAGQPGVNLGSTPGTPVGNPFGTAGILGATGANPATATQGAAGQPGSSSSGSATGRTFGGAPIMGVSSNSDQESLKEMDGHKHYNEWEFTYDPRFDTQALAAAAAQQQQGGQQRGPGAQPVTGPGGTGPGTPQQPTKPQ
ncbi:MAG TPA: hypothetical protein VFA60_14490 [Terriglobales bacterium]|nr:hypothetical protein [Terriglobales bacterium]